MSVPYPSHRLQLLNAKTPGRLLIHEIYRSIQGESTFAGLALRFRPHWPSADSTLRLVRHAARLRRRRATWRSEEVIRAGDWPSTVRSSN